MNKNNILNIKDNLSRLNKIKVGILGATGAVGQRFVSLLENHPIFELTDLVASERSANKLYSQTVKWILEEPMPKNVKDMKVKEVGEPHDAKLFFSALDSSVAQDIEMNYIKNGFIIISNAKNYRMNDDVPLMLADINGDHIRLLDFQNYGSGKIITNPNCVVSGLATCLKPIYDNLEIDFVNVVSMQAISGAGYPGVPSMDIVGNIIPYIKDEEKKIEIEPLKILGKIDENGFIKFADFKIFAQSNRVPVVNGHTASVMVKFKQKQNIDDIKSLFINFDNTLNIESKFGNYKIIVFEDRDDFPQPRFDVNKNYGMSVFVGHLNQKDDKIIHFVYLVHNTIRGAAGAAILNAEYFCSKNINLKKYNII